MPDGKVLLGGVSLDPEFSLAGKTAEVIGTDAPALPVAKTWRRLGAVETGKLAVPKLEDAGKDDEIELKTEKEIQAAKKKKAQEDKDVAATPRDLSWRQIDTVETATVYRKLAWSDLEATGFLAG